MKMKSNVISLFGLLAIFGLTTGCATMNDLLGKRPDPPALEQIESAPRYSEAQNLGVPTDRQYKRMTKNRLEEEADVASNAGSSWVMEGQGAYLFAQNKMRRDGDMLNVKLDSPAMRQVQTKVSVIKKLLKQLEEQEKPAPALGNSLASTEAGRAPAAADAAKPEEKKDEGDEKDLQAEVENIPTRIVEKLPDGNYRIKGQQPFMIGKREYKVILTGMIRPEDFNDEGITSQKLLDPQYDVVSIRRTAQQ